MEWVNSIQDPQIKAGIWIKTIFVVTKNNNAKYNKEDKSKMNN